MSRAHARQQWRARFRGENAVQSIARATPMGSRRPGAVPGLKEQAKTAACGLRIRIEELELRGVGPIDERQVAAALHAELKTLIAANGVPRSWERDLILERAGAAPPAAATRVSAKWVGSQVGRTIYNLRSRERR
jgi:hypothetical protein